MHLMDEENMIFLVDAANYCYRVMPFGLKNVSATYQGLMDKILQPMIGINVEVCVDDMVVTSIDEENIRLKELCCND